MCVSNQVKESKIEIECQFLYGCSALHVQKWLAINNEYMTHSNCEHMIYNCDHMIHCSNHMICI